jgi:CRISPR-associated protein Csx10
MPHRILIAALGPLVFPSRKPDTQFSQSLGYVPGIALWGALGAQLGKIPEARFANALPARKDDAWVRVLPATAMSCKRHPGFLKPPDDPPDQHPPHGAFDTLIDRACWEQLRPAAFTYDPHCPACLGRGDAFGGFYARHEEEGSRYQKREAVQRLLTRVAIDRRRGTAAEGQLYSPLAIAEVSARRLTPAERAAPKAQDERNDETTVYEPTHFLGLAWNLWDKERDHLQQVDVLGGRRSSGLGQVAIEICEEEAAGDMAARLLTFKDTFRARCRLMQSAAPTAEPDWSPDDWTMFSVGLQTEAVLLENGWRPSIVLSPAQLPAELGAGAKLVRAWAGTRVAGGWNIRWNRHRPTVLTVPAGATYLFRTKAKQADVAPALAALEEHGVGERRAEGYGVVRCCDEFHTQAIGGVV